MEKRNEIQINTGDEYYIVKLFRWGSKFSDNKSIVSKLCFLFAKLFYKIFARYCNGYNVPLGTRIGGGIV